MASPSFNLDAHHLQVTGNRVQSSIYFHFYHLRSFHTPSFLRNYTLLNPRINPKLTKMRYRYTQTFSFFLCQYLSLPVFAVEGFYYDGAFAQSTNFPSRTIENTVSTPVVTKVSTDRAPDNFWQQDNVPLFLVRAT